jgi:hypothetical protein
VSDTERLKLSATRLRLLAGKPFTSFNDKALLLESAYDLEAAAVLAHEPPSPATSAPSGEMREGVFIPPAEGDWAATSAPTVEQIQALVRYELGGGETVCLPCSDGAWVLWKDIAALALAASVKASQRGRANETPSGPCGAVGAATPVVDHGALSVEAERAAGEHQLTTGGPCGHSPDMPDGAPMYVCIRPLGHVGRHMDGTSAQWW